MTGPQHYTEAERLLAEVAEWAAETFSDEKRRNGLTPLVRNTRIDTMLDAALIHATLAQAAATALVMGEPGRLPLSAYDAWQEAAS